jgi:hypothetical protein
MAFQRSLIPANTNKAPSLTSKQYGCFVCPCASTIKRIWGNQTPADFNASRNAGLVLAVSDRALIILAAADGSFAHDDGMSPQRIRESSWIESSGFWRITGTGCGGRCCSGDSSPRRLRRIEVLVNDLLSPRQSVPAPTWLEAYGSHLCLSNCCWRLACASAFLLRARVGTLNSRSQRVQTPTTGVALSHLTTYGGVQSCAPFPGSKR